MDETMFIALGVAALIILVVAFLVKSMLKFVIIGVAVYFLFHLGFIWGVDDLNSKLQITRWFNEEASGDIQNAYSDFTEKRDEYGVVNTEEVKKVIDETLNNAMTKAKNQVDAIDKEALVKELQEKLKQFEDATVDEAIDESQNELGTVMTTEDVNTLKAQP